MGRSLDELASYMRPKAELLLTGCTAIGVPCRVVDTGRTHLEQDQKILDGVSWTKVSKHEPQPPEGKSEALDIVPESILSEHKPNWNPKHPDWQKIGAIGENLGLRWGGRWKHVNESKPGAGDGTGDPSHFEWQEPKNDIEDVIT